MLLLLDDDEKFSKTLIALIRASLIRRGGISIDDIRDIPIHTFTSAIDLYLWVINNPILPEKTVLVADICTPELDPSLRDLQSIPILVWITDQMSKGLVSRIPIYAVTGDTSPQTAVHARSAGVEQILYKPISIIPDVLLESLVNGFEGELRWEREPDVAFLRPPFLQLTEFIVRCYFDNKQRISGLYLTSDDCRLLLSALYPHLYGSDGERRSELIAKLGGIGLIRERLRNDINRFDVSVRPALESILRGELLDLSRRKKEGIIEKITMRLETLWNKG